MTRVWAVLVLALSMQLHAVPAAAFPVTAADVNVCRESPLLIVRPHVRTVDDTVRVDNRCNPHHGALVVVWRMYENSSETFRVPAGARWVEPTLHHGRMRVWVVYSYPSATSRGVSYLHRKQMRYSR